MMILEKYARLMMLDLLTSSKQIFDVPMNVIEHRLPLGNVILTSVLAYSVIRLVSTTNCVQSSALHVF